jgi:hypothetical protein
MLDSYIYHFFFVDIVGLTQDLSTEEQIEKISVLNKTIRDSQSFKVLPPENLVILPTGDGAVIGFPDKMNLPLDLAMELHKKLKEYNRDKDLQHSVIIRVGIHTGPVMQVKDVLDVNNWWGDGLVLARRIMDVGSAGHILLSEYVGSTLWRTFTFYRDKLFHAGIASLKGGRKEFLFYAYGDDFGNNSISGIMDLNVQAKDSDFEAEILDKKIFRLGDTIRTRVRFKGNLIGGFLRQHVSCP